MNNLGSLNNFLFEQLERLNDIDKKDMTEEIERSKAITGVADKIINNAKVVLEVEKFRDDRFDADADIPSMLEG